MSSSQVGNIYELFTDLGQQTFRHLSHHVIHHHLTLLHSNICSCRLHRLTPSPIRGVIPAAAQGLTTDTGADCRCLLAPATITIWVLATLLGLALLYAGNLSNFNFPPPVVFHLNYSVFFCRWVHDPLRSPAMGEGSSLGPGPESGAGAGRRHRGGAGGQAVAGAAGTDTSQTSGGPVNLKSTCPESPLRYFTV